ncbi:MAG: metal ABC transporter substrate-binding protein [Cyanomargarita calcarea GSE-NOS-MK-12-04C]|jgi:manganese transport system substrate-binding protein|uniref:Metal ABC transporter substrate-binding protein n=1 Tax=Cyanomargarita calcarea GSE-NOS-MK-12-04C TaxID=2839659 RepID=A0A951QHA9_9CYAN|nr:metal ABC transporter substrate-binding protein [Cyanomargarita calcarea GSE-NOS-MK-12-04C]
MKTTLKSYRVYLPQYATLASGLLIGFWLVACSPTPSQPQVNLTDATRDVINPDKKLILTTFTVIADMVKNVAGDKAIVESLTKPGLEIHGYQPTPKDLVRAQKADLILDNGLNLERWAEKFYNNVPKVPRITLSQGVQPVDIAEDTYQGKPNPHAWMSPQNALIYVENIRKALVDLDPRNAKTYNTNATAYSQKIKEIDKKLQKAVSVVPEEKRFMVSCEGAFSYIARDYGLKEIYLWAVNSEQQATPKQVEKVINTVKKNAVPVIFCESTVNNEAQLEVAKATGAKFGGVFYVDSLSPSDGPASTYLKLLEHNVTTLINGLLLKSET